MPPFDAGKLLHFGYWMDTDPPAPSQYFTILLIMFTSGLVLGLYVYYVYARHVFQDHTYKRRLWERVSGIAAIVGGIGAFLALMRIIEFPYLSTRAVMYVTILTTLGLLGYLAFYLITRYPQELARYESWALKQQYMPRPRRKARVR